MDYQNLSVDIINIVDMINIKNLPETITEYLHSKSNKHLGNLRKYYSKLLEYVSEDVKESYLNRILKYLSSDKSTIINIIEDFNDGIYDKELKKFASYLADEIYETNDYLNLYEKLNRQVNYIFYNSEKEYCEVKTANNNQDYSLFLYLLIKHAFLNYKTSLPGIVGERLLAEAFTLKINTDKYIKMLKASSMLGNETARMILYTNIYEYDINEATKILVDAKESQQSLWEMGFSLENNFLNKEVIQMIRVKYKYIFDSSDDFIDKITVTPLGRELYYDVTMIMAYKLYYYNYKKYNFTKAINSLGKLLIFDIVSYENDRSKSIEYGKKFLNIAIHLGNVNAIANLSIYYYDNQDDPEYDYESVKKLFKTAASFGDPESNCYYGEVLFNEGNYDEGVKYLKCAAKDKIGRACMNLGKYYELQCDYDNAINYYKKSILYKYYDSAYYMALLYINLKEVQKDSSVLVGEIGINYLKEYYDKLSDNLKKQADKLLENNK